MKTYTHGHIASTGGTGDPNGNRVPLNLQVLTGSGNFVAPVDGVYKITLQGKGGNGAAGDLIVGTSGGGGGSGAAGLGVIELEKGQIVPYDASGSSAWFSDPSHMIVPGGNNASGSIGGLGGSAGSGSLLQISYAGTAGGAGSDTLSIAGLVNISLGASGGTGARSYFGGGGRAGTSQELNGRQGAAAGAGGGGGGNNVAASGSGGLGQIAIITVEW